MTTGSINPKIDSNYKKKATELVATFDPELIEKVAETISIEGRAKYEAASSLCQALRGPFGSGKSAP